jgi:DNA-binding YbaB/EbfC family protein
MSDFDPSSFDLSGLLKQAQALQEKLKQAQERVAEQTVEAEAGGGMVRVVADGGMQVRSIKVDPSLMAANDLAMLQDMIVAAVNEALRRAQEIMSDEMSKLTPFGGLPLPGFLGGRG